MFAKLNVDRISSKALVAELVSDEDGPWAAYGKSGKPITPRQVAHLLAEFEIQPRNTRGEKVLKGYLREWFTDAFIRYLPDPPILSATALQANDINDLEEQISATHTTLVADKNQYKPLKNKERSGVADADPSPKRKGPVCAQCGAHDGKELLHFIGDHEVWLHRECEHWWLVAEGREQRW